MKTPMNLKQSILFTGACCLFLLMAWGAYFGFSPKSASSPVPATAGRSLPPNSSAFFSASKLSGAGSPQVSSGTGKTNPPAQQGSLASSQASPVGKGLTSLGSQETLTASFQVEGKDYVLGTDSFGSFPRVFIKAGQKIPIRLQYTQGQADPDEIVTFQVLDGGGVEKKEQIVKQGKLDQQLATQFNFIAGTQEGIYRIAVTQRGEEKTLQFWVGPEPAMKQVAQTAAQ